MQSRKPQRIIVYDPFRVPPSVSWKLQINLTRADAASLCSSLYSLAADRAGASFYYPDLEADTTKCRYEWHYGRGRDRFGVRLGMVLAVGADGISEIKAYATSADATELATRVAPTFTEREVATFQGEIIKAIQEAVRRSQPEAATPRHIVYHVEVDRLSVLAETLVMPGGRLRVFPTKIMRDGKPISAVAVTVNSSFKELAKGAALKKVNLFCALATLVGDRLYQRAIFNWTKKRPAPTEVFSLDDVRVDRLYPQSVHQQVQELDPNTARRLTWIWSAFHDLPAPLRDQFLPALFAFYAGMTVESPQATVATVAYVAALSVLAKDKSAQCAGEVTCDRCGLLPNFRHNITGDQKAIAQLVVETLQLTDATKKRKVKDLLARVYAKHRSAFVHVAELRHEEFHQREGLPHHLPTADAPVQDIAVFQLDLFSLKLITRRTLLEWMARQIGLELDYLLIGIDPETVVFRRSQSHLITLPKGVLVRLTLPNRANPSGST